MPSSHVHCTFIFFNFALANRNLPAIIWCFVGQTMADESVGLTFLCQQCDIAPLYLRLHRISSRATGRRYAEEPFLLARFLPDTGMPIKNSYCPSRGCSGRS